MNADEKRQAYRVTHAALESVLAGVDDAITAMATTASLLHSNLPYTSWVGFYRVVAARHLRVGPYQGALGCLDIPFERGVCGAAATTRQTQIVPDVHAFPGHIACDAAARSEIVVPVFTPGGELIAVLDLDSHAPDAFDAIDGEELAKLELALRSHFTSNTSTWAR